MSLVSMREVAKQAKQAQDVMHEERCSLPVMAWELNYIELTRFTVCAWPSPVGLRQ